MPVPGPVTAPETQARSQLKTIIDVEFAAEGLTATNDRIHESLGYAGAHIGVSPNRARPLPRDQAVMTVEILVQFYGHYDKEVNPEQTVDPATVENYAERFRRALRGQDPRTNHVWFFRLMDLTYPEDPTGNKTRFEATVAAVGNNPAIMETTG